ncbi:MAG: patatin-like phospholipase family protein [Fluviicola sp.]
MKQLVLVLLIFFCNYNAKAQSIGLVLSGGGASGFAHIGTLKALEERGIKIDFITGTSAGALVGGMYASGYSPAEIEAYVLSETFQLMVKGDLTKKNNFLLRKELDDPSVLNISFSLDSNFRNVLPTNYVQPELMDYEMMRIFGAVSASKNHCFDSLFIPFRCVASDIFKKESKIFDYGYLNQCIRASMTFPFFVNPIKIDDVLYFDGGLYNNFPADVMYNSFYPQFIIGSNVSYNAGAPSEHDLISQLISMMVVPSNFNLPTPNGYIIQHNTDVTTFDFAQVKTAILDGYNATIAQIDSLLPRITNFESKESIEKRRREFKASIIPLNIERVNSQGPFNKDESYTRKSILKNTKNELISEKKLEKRYFRTYATEEIQYLFPLLDKKTDSSYTLTLKVTPRKPFEIGVGGIVSSRAINTGYARIAYHRLNQFASKVELSSHFGKFYGSGKGKIDIDIPSYYPITFSAYGTLQRWDYFRNFATFFEDVRPSFLIQYESYAGIQLKMPILNNSKNTFDFRYFETDDSYYQTDNFTNLDTTDRTKISGTAFTWAIEQNSLNRKQFASEGYFLKASAKLINGRERSISGSKASEKYEYYNNHQWLNLRGEALIFPINTKFLSLGLHGIFSLNSQSLLKNYTATLLNMNSFEPLPDMQTYFLKNFRSPQHIGFGGNLIFKLKPKIDFRFDAYLYQPILQLQEFDDGTFGYSKPFKGEKIVASTSAIYHSPFGPFRLTLNYFPSEINQISLNFTYGFIIFNERAVR